MLKKSKVIALLVVCVMMFAVAQPAFAWSWTDSFWGTVAGTVIGGAAVFFTGGAALPIIGGGSAIGALVGGVEDKEQLVSGAAMGLLIPIVGAAFGVRTN
ncbi:MAG: hypothetical protein IJ587_06965 [Synergistaceae bacterium]|nr:hypothetical protein [Synergistaceae bacterium]